MIPNKTLIGKEGHLDFSSLEVERSVVCWAHDAGVYDLALEHGRLGEKHT
jgi:hypothetical protein